MSADSADSSRLLLEFSTCTNRGSHSIGQLTNSNPFKSRLTVSDISQPHGNDSDIVTAVILICSGPARFRLQQTSQKVTDAATSLKQATDSASHCARESDTSFLGAAAVQSLLSSHHGNFLPSEQNHRDREAATAIEVLPQNHHPHLPWKAVCDCLLQSPSGSLNECSLKVSRGSCVQACSN